MINYGYFRHRFDAHADPKLNQLVDDIGIEGYAYYYTLIEIYGAKVNSQEDKSSAKIHLRTIANTWRKRVDSCIRVLTKLQLSGLLVVTITNSTCELSIPNFLKYYGSYSKKKEKRTLKKRKENKIKESKGNKNIKNETKIEVIADAYIKNKSDFFVNHGDVERCVNKIIKSGKQKLAESAVKENPTSDFWDRVFKGFIVKKQKSDWWMKGMKVGLPFFFQKNKNGEYQYEALEPLADPLIKKQDALDYFEKIDASMENEACTAVD